MKNAIGRLMTPRAIAIVGVSSRTGSAGQVALRVLDGNGFGGDIHLVGRAGTKIGERACISRVDDLPGGVDLAVLAVPANAVKETIEACIRREVAAAVVFASGFAELDATSRALQNDIAAMAAGRIAILGPNCLGFTNFVDRMSIGFLPEQPLPPFTARQGACVAIVSQSGGMMGHLRRALERRGVPLSANVSTGNEAGLQMADFIDHFVGDDVTSVIAVYAEHVRNPGAFLQAIRNARSREKRVVVLHSGRGARAQAAAQSHTGALASDYATMAVLVRHAGATMVESIEEFVDVAEMLAVCGAPSGGVGIMTTSGAYCALAHDYCERVGLDIPVLAQSTIDRLAPRMPSFVPPNNPLDIATQATQDPEIVRDSALGLLDDLRIGCLVAVLASGSERSAMERLKMLVAARQQTTKPIVLALLGEGFPEDGEFVRLARENAILLSLSPERVLRSLAVITHASASPTPAQPALPSYPSLELHGLAAGPQPEWRGKKILTAVGIRTPGGGLATTVEEATSIADRIGYPVVMKAQAAALTHKTEVGGVMLNLVTAHDVRGAWETLHQRLARSGYTEKLDGVLVETMASPGIELIIGARRDPAWGPVVMVGLGGIWIEAIGDVRLMPPDLAPGDMAHELRHLAGWKLLNGFRGALPADVDAITQAASAIGQLMLKYPDIAEIEINPIVAYAAGEGVIALDALVIVAKASSADLAH